MEIQTGNFAVGYPVGPPKPDIQMQTFLTWDFFLCFYFFGEKNQNLLGIQEHCIRKLGKIQSVLKLVWCLLLIFKVVYWDHLTQLLPFARDFIVKGQQLVWCLSGLMRPLT